MVGGVVKLSGSAEEGSGVAGLVLDAVIVVGAAESVGRHALVNVRNVHVPGCSQSAVINGDAFSCSWTVGEP